MDVWPEDLKNAKKAPTPGAMNLFDRGDSEALSKDDREIFHSVVAKGLFVGNRSSPDTLTTISVLSLRVKAPNKDETQGQEISAVFERNAEYSPDIKI